MESINENTPVGALTVSQLFKIYEKLTSSSAPPPPPDVEPIDDRINVDGVKELTGLSKSMIYKLSMLELIPKKKFTRFLVFSRKEILEWIEKQTVSIEPGNKKASRELAKLALRKHKNGM